MNEHQLPTHGKIHAGFVGQKQLPALFKLSGGWTAKEHEARTNLTAGRWRSLEKTPKVLKKTNKLEMSTEN